MIRPCYKAEYLSTNRGEILTTKASGVLTMSQRLCAYQDYNNQCPQHPSESDANIISILQMIKMRLKEVYSFVQNGTANYF